MKRWETKEKAISLRKKGLSYSEIRAKMPLAKSTVSDWCKDIKLTKRQILRLSQLRAKGSYAGSLKGSKVNREKRLAEIHRIKETAKSEVPLLLKEKFWIAGLMLYWAEGNKTEFVGISNSDPKMIKFMVKWFREICKVPDYKFKVQLHLHSGQNERLMKNYWSKISNIPLSQFGKSYIKKEGTGHRKNILYNGTVRISICDLNLLHRIRGWLEAIEIYLPA